MVAQAFVVLAAQDTDAPDLPGVATVSTDEPGDDGGFAIGQAAAERGALWCDRPYWTGNPEPDWLAERCRGPLDAGAVVQVGNELNLELEAFQGGPAAYFALEDEVRQRLGPESEDVLLAMPPSPGVPGWEQWVRPIGHHAVHAYGRCAQMQAIVNWYLANTDGSLFVTECNFGAGNQVDLDAWAEAELRPFLDWCAALPRVRMVAYFAYRWRGAPPMPTSVDGAGTAVEALLTSWTPPMNGGSPFSWDEQTLTIWNLPENPAEVVDWARRLAVSCIEMKTADGDSSWLGEARHLTPDYVAALRQGLPGVAMCGWSYNYCDLRMGPDATTRTPGSRFGQSLAVDRAQMAWDRGNGVPEAEARAAAAAVGVLGLDGHTWDLEIECEGHGDLVAIMLAEGRRLMPHTPFGAHTWAQRSGHERYPWDEIGAGVDVVRPMVYRPTWWMAKCYAAGELGPWLAGKVVAPVLGITESADTVEALDEDVAVGDGEGCVGYGVWEYSGLPGQPGVVDWIAGLAETAPAPEPPPGYDVDAARDRLWAEADALEAGGWPWFGQGIKSLVALSKGDQ